MSEQNAIDPHFYVYKLRKARMMMVQTNHQYAFIYDCLQTAIVKQVSRESMANGGGPSDPGAMRMSVLVNQNYQQR